MVGSLSAAEVLSRILELSQKADYCRVLVRDRSVDPSSELGRRITEFSGGSVLRFCALIDDVVHLSGEGRALAVSMCARGAVETAGILAEFRRKFQNALDPFDDTDVVFISRNFVFASKGFGASREIATPHVLNGVRALDRECSGVFSAYEILCETVHPNWAGRLNVNFNIDEVDRIAATRIYVAALYLDPLCHVVSASYSRCLELVDKHQADLSRLMRPRSSRMDCAR